jgi:prepilin-type N-terminal cleavage/methylation domain-containing protein
MAIIRSQSARPSQAGVTLVELLIVIGIFAVVSSVLMFNYSDFSTNVSIRNLSQEIALTIRKAQTYATSVQSVASAGERSYPAYGITFSLDQLDGQFKPKPTQFVLFSDITKGNEPLSKKYEQSGDTCGSPEFDNECLESYVINGGDSIVSICFDEPPSGTRNCYSQGIVSITFRRPSPDAIICYQKNQEEPCAAVVPSYVDIVLRSVKGIEKTVSVWNTGQISVQ